MPITNNDTDVQLYIEGGQPGFMVELYIPSGQKHTITSDVESIGEIRRQLDKEHGVSRIGDVTLGLKNKSGKYNKMNASSIFYGKQTIKDWVRITSGWGPSWSTDPAVQFQGRIKYLEGASSWRARMVVYDALQDLADAAVGTDTTTELDANNNAICRISETQVPGMNPIDILEYLIDDLFQLTWLNMDSLESESLIDTDSFDAAREATSDLKIGDTTWPAGSKLFDMATGLMKLCGGYLYTGKDGKLNVYVFAPSRNSDSARSSYSFEGDVTVKEPEIIRSRSGEDVKTIVNQVTWKYGQSQIEHASQIDTTSKNLYGLQTLDLETRWELYNGSISILDAMSYRIMRRFALPIQEYEVTISFLKNGDGLAVDLGNIISITDPSLSVSNEYVEVHQLGVRLDRQEILATLYDASALRGKFWFCSSAVDQHDGLGITGNNFAVNWLNRFLFCSRPDDDAHPGFDDEGDNDGEIDPSVAPLDDWGNGIEEHFILW